MKRVLCTLIAAFLLCVGQALSAPTPIPSSPKEWVTDTNGFLSGTVRNALNARLETYDRASGHQVLVWIGKTTGGAPLEDWTVRAFQAWRVGRTGMDDGVVLFLLTDDRAARIEVGYGLEDRVTDAAASRIINEAMILRLRAGDPDGAVTAGVDRLLAAIGGEGAGQGNSPAPPLSPLEGIAIGLLVIGMIALAIRYPSQAFYLITFLLSRGGQSRAGGGSGGGGFVGRGGRSGGGGASGRW